MRQYLDEIERHMLEARMEQAGSQATDESPLAWVTLEPGDDHLSNFTATCHSWPHETTVTLADSGAHGPPVVWRPTHRKRCLAEDPLRDGISRPLSLRPTDAPP